MLQQTIETLIHQHEWLTGKRAFKPEAIAVGNAVNHAISVLMEVENLIKQRGRHNTEIAYKALEISTGGL